MRRKVSHQLQFNGRRFKRQLFFGGSYCSQRAHRVSRPLTTRHPLHLVLKASVARGARSFWRKDHAKYIDHVTRRFGLKFAVDILDCVNVGNHLHLKIKLASRHTYAPFIRAVTAAIRMRVGGQELKRFWDFRPYSRIVEGHRNLLQLNDYLAINRLEGFRLAKVVARRLLQKAVDPPEPVPFDIC
jgi:hypothetical protein